MVVEVDLYRVRIRFEKLFADPLIFEHVKNLARSYLLAAGASPEKTSYVHQATRSVVPVDDDGKPSAISGTGPYRYHGKRVSSEYMRGANLGFEYVDFGSGLSEEEHAELWKKGKWEPLRFETREFGHQRIQADLPEIKELYGMLKVRAVPTTLASVELPGSHDGLFQAALGYMTEKLTKLADAESMTVEVYAARDLSREEKQALENRLGRQFTASTVHVILSRAGMPKTFESGSVEQSK